MKEKTEDKSFETTNGKVSHYEVDLTKKEKNMTTDLMTPRVKLIKYYPGCLYPIGSILYYQEQNDLKIYCLDGFFSTYAADVEKATANFRLLQWWEYRSIDQMPEYVKEVWGDDVIFYKVDHWRMGDNFMFGYESADEEENCVMMGQTGTIQYISTEQEYNDYINSKK